MEYLHLLSFVIGAGGFTMLIRKLIPLLNEWDRRRHDRWLLKNKMVDGAVKLEKARRGRTSSPPELPGG